MQQSFYVQLLLPMDLIAVAIFYCITSYNITQARPKDALHRTSCIHYVIVIAEKSGQHLGKLYPSLGSYH